MDFLKVFENSERLQESVWKVLKASGKFLESLQKLLKAFKKYGNIVDTLDDFYTVWKTSR